MNDDGWGCAYRSLQTLCSWFRLNGYSNKSVPTHRQIQQMLVDMGAMEKKLIGSSDWIGANEVGYCLQKQFGVRKKEKRKKKKREEFHNLRISHFFSH